MSPGLRTQAGTGALPGNYRVLLTKITGPRPGRPAWVGRKDPPSEKEKAALGHGHDDDVTYE